MGYCIHTYNGSQTLQSYEGEPYQLPLLNSIDENLKFYWDLLDENNRVSIAVKEIEIATKSSKIEIINKNKA